MSRGLQILRRHRYLWTVDFASFAAGNYAALPMGLALARASDGHSVQTGPNTVALIGAGNNLARLGRRGSTDPMALVFEHASTNITALRAMSGGAWLDGNATQGADVVGPDGATLAHAFSATNAQFSDFHTQGASLVNAATYTGSIWTRASTAGVKDTCGFWIQLGTATANASGTLTETWERRQCTQTANGTAHQVVPVDGRAVGGLSAAARDAYVDFCQLEAGKICTEWVPTGTRAGERLYTTYPSVSQGKLRLELDLQPKGARADYASAIRVWTLGSDYAEINPTTGVMTISIGGETNTTAAMNWAANDRVRLWIASGGGAASVVSYKVNNGATASPAITGDPLGNLTALGTPDLLCNGTSNQFTAWVRSVSALRPGKTPAWL